MIRYEVQPMSISAVESILALDWGSTTVKAILIDKVEGEHRLIARGEVPTTPRLMPALMLAIGQIEEATGRVLLDQSGKPIVPEQRDGSGVDAFVVTSSAAPPLRLVLMGLVEEVSIASARRALSYTYCHTDRLISLGEPWTQRKGQRSGVEARVEDIWKARPDVVVIVGGTEGGAVTPVLDLAETAAMACTLLAEEGTRPTVVLASNTEARQAVSRIIGDKTELLVVDNPRPQLERENLAPLQEELESLYQERKLAYLPGYGNLKAWSQVPILPTARAFSYTVQYLARQYKLNILGVDLGGTTTTVVASLDGHLERTVRTDLGLGASVGSLMTQGGLDDVLRWLPFELDEAEARHIILNKKLRPATVPQTREELLLEQALAREALRRTVTSASEGWPKGRFHLYPDLCPLFDLIIGSGGALTGAPRPGQAALILLDAIQPIGVSVLSLDVASTVALLGAVATLAPLAAAQVLDKDALLTLGTVVAPIGTAREGDLALRMKVTYADGRFLEVEVAYGSLEVIPLAPGQRASLELRPTRAFDVGLGVKGRGANTEVEGGILGLIVDARGRPLVLPADPEERRNKVQKWLWDIGA